MAWLDRKTEMCRNGGKHEVCWAVIYPWPNGVGAAYGKNSLKHQSSYRGAAPVSDMACGGRRRCLRVGATLPFFFRFPICAGSGTKLGRIGLNRQNRPIQVILALIPTEIQVKKKKEKKKEKERCKTHHFNLSFKRKNPKFSLPFCFSISVLHLPFGSIFSDSPLSHRPILTP